ncbi:MAG: hypothetical protein GC179_28050 [Anaerolineaceae bacterium]|nr:hypothetical protein [Anaerolineaceae bacterium]
MSDVSRMSSSEMRPKVWELRRGEEVIGLLSENDWYQPPFRGYDFWSNERYKKYAPLFEALIAANNQSWEVSIASKGAPSEETNRIDERLDQLKGQIGSLKLTMHPLDQAAPDARVVLIFIDKGKAQLIPDFERYNPFDYYEWSADE